jgi:glycosyltransferase involved in cell wall biosynthesis
VASIAKPAWPRDCTWGQQLKSEAGANELQPARIQALYPNYYLDHGVGHCCKSVLEGMMTAGTKVDMTVLACRPEEKEPFIHRTFPNRGSRYFLGPLALGASRLMRWMFCRRLAPGDVAYFWLSSPPELVACARRRGAFVVREMINCTAEFRRDQFLRAYDLLGWPQPTLNHAAIIAEEREQLLACDAIFCPSPLVLKSVAAYGLKHAACLPSSYGWSRRRFRPHRHGPTPHKGVNVLFVGTVGVRKGAPWLLEAWSRAKIDGTLILAGAIDGEMADHGASLLERPTVSVLGQVTDVASLYNAADIFVLPTWEEGAPLVTFEAMAHGVPLVVTPMAAAGVVTEHEGIIVEPGSVDALVEALVRLAASRDERHQLGTSAFEASKDYEWQRTGERRVLALANALARSSSPVREPGEAPPAMVAE